jgi:gamma-tubulin complex component 3
VFLLTYRLDEPLNAVITDEAMQRYHQIFSYLWRLKRVEYTLSSTWKQHTTAAHKVRKEAV